MQRSKIVQRSHSAKLNNYRGLITCRKILFSQLSLKNPGSIVGAIGSMDYLEKVLEKLKEWARKLIETLLGPEMEPEPEPIPIPVNERARRHR